MRNRLILIWITQLIAPPFIEWETYAYFTYTHTNNNVIVFGLNPFVIKTTDAFGASILLLNHYILF